MMSLALKPTFSAAAKRNTRSNVSNKRCVVVRAESSPQTTETTPSGSTVFYAGKAYTEGEWKEAVATGTVTPVESDPSESTGQVAALSLGDIMAFSGPAPELINGRLAMLAFIAAVGAELSTGESVVRQLADEPTGILLAAITFISASLIPLVNNSSGETVGPFTEGAEKLNGRAAMIGFAALLIIEGVKGSALF